MAYAVRDGKGRKKWVRTLPAHYVLTHRRGTRERSERFLDVGTALRFKQRLPFGAQSNLIFRNDEATDKS